MPRSSRFKRQVASGYIIIILLLSVPAAVAIGNAYLASRMRESATATQLLRLQRADELGSREAALTTAAWTYTPDVLDERRRAFDDAMTALRQVGDTPENGVLIDRIGREAEAYLAVLDRLGQVQVTGPSEEVKRVFNQLVLPQRQVLIQALDDYARHQGKLVASVREEAELAFVLMIIVPSAAFLLAIAASIWFARRSIRELRLMYEREEAAKDRATRAVADRDELQGILAHDLRSPLNAISMQAGLLQVTNDISKARRQGRLIELVTRQMSQLMQTLLDAGRIHEGHLTIDPEPVDAVAVLRETLMMFEAQAGDRRIELRLPVDRPELEVMAERERLVQVISNLMSNALRFTPSGGRIVLAASVEEGSLRVTVTDTGPGIRPEHLGQVFDRYFTISNGKVKGTGLGLYITRTIIEAHGGRIWVESEPGHGAKFHFTLPLAVPATLQHEASAR